MGTEWKTSALLVAMGVLLAFVSLEVVARVWVAVKWTDADIVAATEPILAHSGYEYDAETGYRLQPGFVRRDPEARTFSHNSRGFRGPELEPVSEGQPRRVVIAGASTVYGLFVDDSETSSALLEKELNRQSTTDRFEVVDAGVPGWTSRETVINTRRNIGELKPDFVLLLDGRNDLFPETFDGYQLDYSHYRPIGRHPRDVNRAWKRVFTFSRLAMLLIPNNGGRLGYSTVSDDLVYGYVRGENRPSFEDLIARTMDDEVTAGWRRNVEEFVSIVEAHDATPMLVEMPFLASQYGSAVLHLADYGAEHRDEGVAALDALMTRNNTITRQVASERGVPFVATHDLARPDLLVDDCHFRAAGERLLAERLAAAILAEMKGEATDTSSRPRRNTRLDIESPA